MLLKKWTLVTLAAIILLLGGCSSGNNKEASLDSAAKNEVQTSESKKVSLNNEENSDQTTEKKDAIVDFERKVIYTANLYLRVKNYQKVQLELEKKLKSYGGYIVESNIFHEDTDQTRGTMVMKIPEKNFQAFLHDAEGQAVKVIERQVNGQDVTEEFVDLKSRLKSKKVVEERLLQFMKQAEKTEDLLKISNDLARVQEEIEQIEGRMKFLNHQTAYSTVTITMDENRIVIPEIDQQNLNTWEKTKKQLATSLNILLAILSGTIVLIVGNIPILIVVGAFITIIFLIFKRKRNRKQE